MGFLSSKYRLDRSQDSKPFYLQLKRIIKKEVSSGELEPGDQIPTEHKLCEEFDISRTPVRQALQELVNEGVLSRQQGSGTFVSKESMEEVSISALITEGQWATPLSEAVDKYNQKRNGTPVNLNMEILGRPHFRERFLTYIGKGEAPDLALVDSAWVTEFAAYRFIEPLSELDSNWLDHIQDQLLKPFLARNRYNEALYALQPEANVSLLWYRKDVFKRLDLDPPISWRNLVETSEKLKGEGWDYPLAFAGGTAAGETTTYQLLPLIWSAGGAIFKDHEVGLRDGGVKAVNFLGELVLEHEVAPPNVHDFSWDEPARLFAEGEVAMAFGGSYEKKKLLQESGWSSEEFDRKVGWTALPGLKQGQEAATTGGMAYVILRQAEHPELAMEILKEVLQPTSIIRFCRRNDRIPTTKGAIDALDPTGSSFSHQVTKLLAHAHAPPGLVQYANISEQIQLMIERVLTEQMTPEKSVQKAAEVIEALK
jgi:multiple sugar transport system substrate-binding protein